MFWRIGSGVVVAIVMAVVSATMMKAMAGGVHFGFVAAIAFGGGMVGFVGYQE